MAIDPVRSIVNQSRGRFGSDLALAALQENCEVSYFASAEAESPFELRLDVKNQTLQNLEEKLRTAKFNWSRYSNLYREKRFLTFEEYSEGLEHLVKTEKPDVIFLAAAASDYLVESPASGKLRSGSELQIALTPAPKLIRSVKKWSPSSLLVGFKLLVSGTDEELLAAAQKQKAEAGSDWVVSNSLTTILAGAHTVLLVSPKGTTEKITENIGKAVFARVLEGLG